MPKVNFYGIIVDKYNPALFIMGAGKKYLKYNKLISRLNSHACFNNWVHPVKSRQGGNFGGTEII